MIIDFHTHVFPPKIAKSTVEKLSACPGVKAYTDGTPSGLGRSMKSAGVDISVTLPITVKAGQEQTVNGYAAQISGKGGIISFGSVHPFSENWREGLRSIAALGLKGVKLHPYYQNFFIDDKRVLEVAQYAASLDLIVLIHSGFDVGFPNDYNCSPKAANTLACAMKGAKLVFAHMGGYDCWGEVERFLVGKDVYFDTSFCVGRLSDSDFLRMIKSHGAEKCLFGSDSPWECQAKSIEFIKRLPLSDGERDMIFYKNAAHLLGIGE